MKARADGVNSSIAPQLRSTASAESPSLRSISRPHPPFPKRPSRAKAPASEPSWLTLRCADPYADETYSLPLKGGLGRQTSSSFLLLNHPAAARRLFSSACSPPSPRLLRSLLLPPPRTLAGTTRPARLSRPSRSTRPTARSRPSSSLMARRSRRFSSLTATALSATSCLAMTTRSATQPILATRTLVRPRSRPCTAFGASPGALERSLVPGGRWDDGGQVSRRLLTSCSRR